MNVMVTMIKKLNIAIKFIMASILIIPIIINMIVMVIMIFANKENK